MQQEKCSKIVLDSASTGRLDIAFKTTETKLDSQKALIVVVCSIMSELQAEVMGTVQPSLHYKYMQHLVLRTVCS